MTDQANTELEQLRTQMLELELRSAQTTSVLIEQFGLVLSLIEVAMAEDEQMRRAAIRTAVSRVSDMRDSLRNLIAAAEGSAGRWQIGGCTILPAWIALSSN